MTARKRAVKERHQAIHHLSDLALRACMVACDAAYNVKDFLQNSSRMALLAVRDCEKELDRIEQDIDEQLPAAITLVSEPEARELLAASRFSGELERIGDLLFGLTKRIQNLDAPLSRTDSQQLLAMVEILEEMLQQLRKAFENRDLEGANYVLSADREIDRVYKGFFRRLQMEDGIKRQQCTDALLLAQVLERAGDHATNLAEELFRLIEGRSLRHVPKRETKD